MAPADGFQGAAVAAAVVARLEERGLKASSRALLPWPSLTPEVGVVIFLEIASVARAIAVASTWHVHPFGPPGIARPTWTWGMEAFPNAAPPRIPDEAIADGLASLAARWAHEEASLGLLDVTYALIDALPPVDGGWRVYVNDHDAWMGVERGARRWPSLLQVRAAGQSLEVVVFGGPPDGEKRWRVRLRSDFERVKEEIAACVARLLVCCLEFVAQRQLLETFADRLTIELGTAHVPPAGHWRVRAHGTDLFSAGARPSLRIEWGDEQIYGASTLTLDDTNHLVADGVAYADDTPMVTLTGAIATTATRACVLRAGARYRLRKDLGGYRAGDVLRFLRAESIRPDDTLYYAFEALPPAVGPEHVDGMRRYYGLGLSEVSADDAGVMNAMQDWFECIEDELEPAKARARRVDALAAVGRHLREHGAIEAALVRFVEALTLDGNHVMATFQRGWVAAQQDRWPDALAFFSRTVELDPTNIDARNNTAWALGRLGRWEEALTMLGALAAEHPKFVYAHRNRAWVLRSLGSLDEAVSACDEALRLDARYPDALHERGLIAMAYAKWDEAIGYLERAAELSPLDATIRASLEKARASST
jgi:tetratricopeptide (TPR) repeat protein